MRRNPRARRLALALAIFVPVGAAIVAQPSVSGAAVTAVKGSAFGVSEQNIKILNGAQPTFGPTPSVTLPPGGSASPITGHDNSEVVAFGPAVLFESGAVDVSTQGTTGTGGSATSTATINGITTANGGQFSADKLVATCTANQSGVTGSTTVTNGLVATNSDSSGPVGTPTPVPTNPAPNTVITGQLVLGPTDTETFTDTFNEQTTNPDGSLTVTAYHQHLNGPTTTGDIYVGQVTCGVTAVPDTTLPPTTLPPTTLPPTTLPATTLPPTTLPATTLPPTTLPPTTLPATTLPPTTLPPTTLPPTTLPPTTLPPTTLPGTTLPPITIPPITIPPITIPPITLPPTTQPATTLPATTAPPTTQPQTTTTVGQTTTTVTPPGGTTTTRGPVAFPNLRTLICNILSSLRSIPFFRPIIDSLLVSFGCI